MARFMSKQVIIEAYQVLDKTDDNTGTTPGWLVFAVASGKVKLFKSAMIPGRETFTVETDEGIMEGKVGDWIIKGLEGELYPCRDSVFKAKYDLVE